MRLCIWMLNVHLHASPSLAFGVLEEIQVLVSHSQIFNAEPIIRSSGGCEYPEHSSKSITTPILLPAFHL